MKRLCLAVLLLAGAGCSAKPELPKIAAVPDFRLTERSHRIVDRQQLAGSVWIADFIFTQCAGICPTMTARMRQLQDILPRDIRLVSFSVDPANDTPEALRAYADKFGADSERWMFLTGDSEAMHDLSISGFKLALDDSGGTAEEPITHSSRFVLVDREGWIRGYYGMDDAGSMERLTEDARKLM